MGNFYVLSISMERTDIQLLEEFARPVRELRKRFIDLTEPHRPALWRYCLRLTGSAWDAEDLVQETMLKAFSRLASFGQSLNPKGYLFRTATNTWIDGMRKKKILNEDLETAQHIPAKETTTARAETRAAMEFLVNHLPPRQRVILLLIDIFDFTAAETAAMTQSTEGAVKAALFRAREALRKLNENQPSKISVQSGLTPSHPVFEKYLEAFNNRDPEALAALLHTDATVEVVGDWEEHGLETAKKFSLEEWGKDKRPQWAEFGYLEGQLAVFTYFKTPECPKALYELITLEIAENRIVHKKWYFFSPELVAYAAEGLGVPAVSHGYRYVPPTT